MEIGGLPVHPLAVHAAVVLGPLGALTALAYAGLAGWRDRLRWPMLATAVVATGCVVAAYVSGNDLLESRPALAQKSAVGLHEDRAGVLLWLTLGFAAVAVAAGTLHRRSGRVVVVTRLALVAAALAVLVQVVLTGDAGTRAVWQGAPVAGGPGPDLSGRIPDVGAAQALPS